MRFDKSYFDLRIQCKRARRKWLKYWVLTLGAHGCFRYICGFLYILFTKKAHAMPHSITEHHLNNNKYDRCLLLGCRYSTITDPCISMVHENKKQLGSFVPVIILYVTWNVLLLSLS